MSTERPSRTAVTEDPPPRWQTTSRGTATCSAAHSPRARGTRIAGSPTPPASAPGARTCAPRSGIVAWNAVSKTATCGTSGSALPRVADRGSAGALWSGASGASAWIASSTSSVTTTGSGSAARRARPGARRRRRRPSSSTRGRFAVLDDVELEARRAGVDDEDPHRRQPGSSGVRARPSATRPSQIQSRTSGMSSPTSRVYARWRSRSSAISCRSAAARREAGDAVDHVDDEVEAVEVVQHDHVERRRRRALLLVAAHVDVLVVRAPVRQPVDEPRIAVVGEDDRPVAREERVELRVGEPVRVLALAAGGASGRRR